MDSLPKATSLADENLRRLLSMRALSVGGQVLAILVAMYYLDMALPFTPLLITLMCLIIWSVFTLFFIKNPIRITDNFFFLQLIVDVIALTAVLFFTGGATNPFAWFLLVPHSVASTLLSRRYVWLMALITSLSYTLIVFYYRPLVHLDHPMEMGMGGHFSDHVVGMWIGFVLSTMLMAYFVAGMAESLRKRNELLMKMKEQIFRDERLVALGTLATAAAHELGTPLGTMDVLAHELELELQRPANRSMSDKLSIIQGQIKRCKKVLSSITETVAVDKYDAGQLLAVDDYLASVIAQWRISHLDVNLIEIIKGLEPTPSIVANVALTHALINILDNAAQASPTFVSISLDWDDDSMIIEVEDQGDGMEEAKIANLGVDMRSSKMAGLGIGIYLSKATIERMGGEIRWGNKKPNGVRVTISIPLLV
ncbi:MAG: ATP-binding protein [Cycloclasticus sp.]|nr:ATP-binding protein [Cycloclasticus sp.]